MATDTINLTREAMAPDWSSRKIHARAMQAAIWGMPIVSMHAMREAFFRDAGARYGDIVYWSRVADWKLQLKTPNASSYYVYLNFNTKHDPVVVDIPPAVGGGLFGSILDAWQIPLVDVGPAGEDQGNGGKYLLLPPGYRQDVPAGFIPVHSNTFNGYAVFRIIPDTSSGEYRKKAIAMIKKIQTYPLSEAVIPPVHRHIDMSGKLFDGIVRFDDSFYSALSGMLNEEPFRPNDPFKITQLSPLGIETGKTYKPDEFVKGILQKAIEETHAGFIDNLINGITPYWKGTNWGVSTCSGTGTQFSFLTDEGEYKIDDRAMSYFLACAPPKKLGAATFYLAAACDASHRMLRGEKIYQLQVPANVPVKQYWSVTVYDVETASFIRDAPVLAIDSYHPKVQKNDDGSVDLYFAPEPPPGKEYNWIFTEPGKLWFAFFRFYGHGQAVFDKTWRMNDIRQIT